MVLEVAGVANGDEQHVVPQEIQAQRVHVARQEVDLDTLVVVQKHVSGKAQATIQMWLH